MDVSENEVIPPNLLLRMECGKLIINNSGIRGALFSAKPIHAPEFVAGRCCIGLGNSPSQKDLCIQSETEIEFLHCLEFLGCENTSVFGMSVCYKVVPPL